MKVSMETDALCTFRTVFWLALCPGLGFVFGNLFVMLAGVPVILALGIAYRIAYRRWMRDPFWQWSRFRLICLTLWGDGDRTGERP